MKNFILFILVFFGVIKLTDMIFKGDIKLPTSIQLFIDSKSMLDGDTIHIVGLGKFNNSKIIEVKKIITRRIHLPVVIDKPIVSIPIEFFYNGYLNVNDCLSNYDDMYNKILVTDYNCYSSKQNERVGGYSEMYGNILIIGHNGLNKIERVLIHEIGHNIGLSHCYKNDCVMNEKRDNDNIKINFCVDCKQEF